MPEMSRFEKLNELIHKLSCAQKKNEILISGFEVADEIMHILGIPYDQLDKGEDELDKAIPNSKFKNQKMEQWFEKHPYLGNSRIALYHYNRGVYPIESMFYMLADTPRKEKIAATTQLFVNWEDSSITMIPSYKVGVDFFLSPKTKSLLFVVSKKTNLRVMELSERLTNTQIEIFNKLQNVALTSGIDKKTGKQIPFEPQRTIHTTLWNALELKEVNKKFYVGIADHFTLLCQYLTKKPPEGLTVEDITESSKIFSSRLIGRLLFVWFLRKKGIINSKYPYFDVNDVSSTDYYETRLKKLFFNTLNKPVKERTEYDADLLTPYLNGGLFEPHKTDWYDKKVEFPEGWFVSLFGHLNEFNFTTDESSTEYEQVAIDPEMLGRVFENLLASIVPETKDAANERSKKGAFYTPREIVSYMCKSSLKEYLKRNALTDKDYDGIDKLIDLSDSDYLAQKSTGTADLWGSRSPKVKAQLIESLNNLKVLDPACGSGAFPIGMLQLLLKTYDRLTAFYDEKIKKMRSILPAEHNDLYQTKLFIIRNSLYGVDIEPMAIEIARLRAWLSLIIDDKKDVEPLPNLDFNFVCANTLIPLTESDGTMSLFFDENQFKKDYDSLIDKYFNTHDYETKQTLRKQFKELLGSIDMSDNSNSNIIARMTQLSSWNPFDSSKPADFFDSKTMFNVERFDVVIGNPPYVQLQSIQDKKVKTAYQKVGYESFDSMGDMYCLFIEKGVTLLKEHGILTFITSNKWMRAGYGGKLRKYLSGKNPILLIDFGGTKIFESATVDTDILMIANEDNLRKTLACEIRDDDSAESITENLNDYISINKNKAQFVSEESWGLLNPIEQSIKNKIESNGLKLDKWDINIYRGVLTGYNDAFIIDKSTAQYLLKNPVNAEIIRPIIRGRDIKKYTYISPELYLINFPCGFTNKMTSSNDKERFMREKYPEIFNHFEKFKNIKSTKSKGLLKRDDQGDYWWELRSCVYLDVFKGQVIAWQRITQKNTFCLTQNGTVVLDSMAFLSNTNIYTKYLLGFLNSSLVYYWMRKNVHEYGSSGFRLSNQYVKEIPVPTNKKFIDAITSLMNEENNLGELHEKIDSIIFEFYKFTLEEKDKILTID